VFIRKIRVQFTEPDALIILEQIRSQQLVERNIAALAINRRQTTRRHDCGLRCSLQVVYAMKIKQG